MAGQKIFGLTNAFKLIFGITTKHLLFSSNLTLRPYGFGYSVAKPLPSGLEIRYLLNSSNRSLCFL